jgi:cysteine desulfurase
MQFVYAAEQQFANLKAENARLALCREKLWSLLDKELFVRLSSEEGSPYILLVSAAGLRGAVLQQMADDNGLIIGTGSACSSNSKLRFSKIALACGYDQKIADGVLRLSFSHETTEKEIEQAAEILNKITRELKNRMK